MTETAKDSFYDSITRNTDKDIMDAVGEKGCWQTGISVQIFFIMSVLAIHNFSMSFLAPNQDYWCVKPADATNNFIQYWKNLTMPKGDEHCYRYNISNLTDFDEYNSSIVQLTRCIAFEYDKTFYASTLVSKWNLVCHRKWLISLAKSIFMCGILVSNVLFGHLSDRFGRKPIIISCSIITAFFSLVSAFCTSISSFIVLRFLTGVGLGGYYNTAFVLLMEIVVPKMRSVYGLGMQLGWSLGFVCLPGIAWIFRDVFWLQIALAVPAFIQVACLSFIPESPRWLLSHGRVEEARDILLHAMKRNKLPVKDLDRTFQIAEINIKHENEKHDELSNLLQLLKTPSLRRMTIFLFLIWFVIPFVYYGFSFNTNELSGNPFANFALSGAMEFPAYFLAMFIIHSVGRKKPLATAMIVGGITYIILNLIPIDSSTFIVAAAMIAKFFITCAYGILYVFTTELFPTVVRNIGLGLSTVFEGLGSILAPFMRELGNATHPAIPQFLFGILSVGGGALVLFLRETNNQIIPDTLEEAIEIYRREERNSTSLKENKLAIPKVKR